MNVNIIGQWIRDLEGKGLAIPDHVKEQVSYRSLEREVEVNLNAFDRKTLDAMYDHVQPLAPKNETAKSLQYKIGQFRRLQDHGDTAVAGSVNVVEQILRNYISKTPNKWLFSQTVEGHMLPYYVSGIRYYPAEKDDPAHCDVIMKYTGREGVSGTTVSFHSSDVEDKPTASQLLNRAGYYLEQPEQVELYLQEVEKHKAHSTKLGHQYHGSGYASTITDRWSYGKVSLIKEGRKTKLVMDDTHDEDATGNNKNARGNKRTVPSGVWEGNNRSESSIVPPLHPYIHMFSLEEHIYINVHVGNIEPYQYDQTLSDKLVMEDRQKGVIQMLLQGVDTLADDIVSGKSGGVIILSTGFPGTGKTLTAEVYAEKLEKPLYVVQCSQLGTDEEKLEKRLKDVLYRASRWGAVLLLDEADVYVRERGEDIQQNAIVGVFLRVLEYYNGVLFMTSNKGKSIDDAILSRCTVHLRYEKPTPKNLSRIWMILSAQYNVTLTIGQIGDLVHKLPELSGRNVKSLLKLSSLAAKSGEMTTVNSIVELSDYIDFK